MKKKNAVFTFFWVCYTGFYKYPPTVFWFSCSDNHWGVQFPTTLRSPHICVWFFYWFGLVITTIIIIPFHHNFVQLFLNFFLQLLHCYSLRLHLLKRDAHERKRFETFLCDILSLFDSYFYVTLLVLLFWDGILQSKNWTKMRQNSFCIICTLWQSANIFATVCCGMHFFKFLLFFIWFGLLSETIK